MGWAQPDLLRLSEPGVLPVKRRFDSLRKRHLLEPPSTRRTVWAPHGASLSIRFEPIEPDALPKVRAAVGFLTPGYEAITLQNFSGTEKANLRIWRVLTTLEGDDVEALNTAIRDVLLRHGRRPLGE